MANTKIRIPHTMICEKMFHMSEPQIRYFWGIYTTIAWILPGIHWAFASLCLGKNHFSKEDHFSKENSFSKNNFLSEELSF